MGIQIPIIRRARADDAPAYRAMRIAALQQHPLGFAGDPAEEALRPLEFWQSRLNPDVNPTSATFVADAAGELAGMIVIVQMSGAKLRHTANIYSVYVQPEWRGQGLSDALFNACVGWAAALDIQQLKLSVTANNLAALGSYFRNQFRVYAVDPQVVCVDGVFYDELLMVRQIGNRTI
jgi:ribosomal protein S18 acetylase RimI-like enzyme